MIGDGLNDVLSLKEAGVGVSINAKSELNLLAADVIILNENLWRIAYLFNLMTLANRTVYVNLTWAFAYNLIMARILLYIITHCSRRCRCILLVWVYDFPYGELSSYVHKLHHRCTHLQHDETIQPRSYDGE